MKENIIHFLRVAFPFLLTVGLWRLSGPFWNPAGVLAIIPIFICSFVRPTNWFLLFSMIMCVCLDYNFETVCFWLAMYWLFYAINSFQTYIDITRMDNHGLFAFMVFFGVAIFIQTVSNFSFMNILRGAWMFVWGCALYIPIAKLIKRVGDDR